MVKKDRLSIEQMRELLLDSDASESDGDFDESRAEADARRVDSDQDSSDDEAITINTSGPVPDQVPRHTGNLNVVFAHCSRPTFMANSSDSPPAAGSSILHGILSTASTSQQLAFHQHSITTTSTCIGSTLPRTSGVSAAVQAGQASPAPSTATPGGGK